MKKIAAIILSLILVINVIPVSAVGEDSFTDYKEAIYNGILDMKEEIDLRDYNITAEEGLNYINFLIYQHPEICYFNYKKISYSHYGNIITSLMFEYVVSKEEQQRQLKFIDETINPVLEKVDDGWSEAEKALYVHDWLVSNFMYDYRLFTHPNTENHDIYGFLKDGIGVCESYAATYMYMVRKLGLESYMAINSTDLDNDGTDDALGHGWNVVKIDGKWCHVDATYDDPILGESFTYDYVGEVSHDKFLLSDQQIVKNDNGYEHYGYRVPYVEEEIVCEEYTGNDLWRNAVSSVVPVGEYWYYLDPKGVNGGLLRTKDFKTAEQVMAVGEYSDKFDKYCWLMDDGNGWTRYFTGLFEYNEHLFFSDSKNIYAYDTHHDIVNPLPIERQEGNYFFGLNMKDKSITYITSKTDIKDVTEGHYTLTLHFIVSHWDIVKQPTQTEDGLKVKRCYFCGEIVESQTIPCLTQGKKGDAEGSGNIDTTDLAIIKLYLADESRYIMGLADIDNSGKVDTSDLALMKLYLAGAIANF